MDNNWINWIIKND